jgi:hypothetical protein
VSAGDWTAALFETSIVGASRAKFDVECDVAKHDTPPTMKARQKCVAL